MSEASCPVQQDQLRQPRSIIADDGDDGNEYSQFLSTSSLVKHVQKPSENLLTLQLINTLVHLATGCDSSCDDSSQVFEQPADRLLRCIRNVLREKKLQRVHERLRDLVYSRRRETARAFELPEDIATPRTVQDVEARAAWWWTVRQHPSNSQKCLAVKTSLRQRSGPSSHSSSVPALHTTPSSRAAQPTGKSIKLATADVSWSSAQSTSRRLPSHGISRALQIGSSSPRSPKQAAVELGVTRGTPSHVQKGGITSKVPSAFVSESQQAERRRLNAAVQIEGSPDRSCKLSDPRSLMRARHRVHATPMATLRKRSATVLKQAELLMSSSKMEREVLDTAPDEEIQVPVGSDPARTPHSLVSPKELDRYLEHGGEFPQDVLSKQRVMKTTSHDFRAADFVDVVVDAAGGVIPIYPSGVVLPVQRQRLERRGRLSGSQILGEKKAFRPVPQPVTTVNTPARSASQPAVTRITPKPISTDAPPRWPSALDSPAVAARRARHRTMTPPSLGSVARGLSDTASPLVQTKPLRMQVGQALVENPRAAPPVIDTDPTNERKMTTYDKLSQTPWGVHMECSCVQTPEVPGKQRQRVSSAQQRMLDGHIGDQLDFRARRVRNLMISQKTHGDRSRGHPFGASDGGPPEHIADANRVLETNECLGLDANTASVPAWASDEAAGKDASLTKAAHPVALRATGLKRPARACDAHQVAEAYFHEVTAASQLPRIPKCLQVHQIPPRLCDDNDVDVGLDIDVKHANLSDAQARPLLKGLSKHEVPFKSLLLTGNPRLSDQMHCCFMDLLCSRAAASGRRLQNLDLSGCSGFGDESLQTLTRELRGELIELRVLRLDGILVAKPDHTWPELETSIAALMRLHELSLADMGIGRGSQRAALCVAELLLGAPALTSLNISHNFFSYEGCQALAENLALHPSLARLDISYNAGGIPLPSYIDDNASSTSSSSPSYSPLTLLCEGVTNAQKLEYLGLAQCNLTYDEDFVLEDALAHKTFVGTQPVLRDLDLTGNRCQGRLGARSLVRMMALTTSLRHISLNELDDALPLATSIPYEMTDPSAQYHMNLGHPQHRALLRTLLRRCKELNKPPENVLLFTNADMERRILGEWKAHRHVPTAGEATFTFDFPIDDDEQDDISEHLARIDRQRKMNVSLWYFIRLCDLYRCMVNSKSRKVLLGAMPCDFYFQLHHVKYVADLDGSLCVDVVDALLPAVSNFNRNSGFETVVKANAYLYGPNAAPLHKSQPSTLRLLLFNPYCMQTHYQLDMSLPSDRKMLEMIILINSWEASRARRLEHPDLSQHGGHECLRNCTINGTVVVWRNADFTIPSRGDVIFDFCTPFHAAAPQSRAQRDRTASSEMRSSELSTVDSGDESADEDQVKTDDLLRRILFAVKATALDPFVKIAILRTCLHHLVLQARHCAEVIKAFVGERSTDVKLTPCAEAFVSLYPRCTDIGELLSSKSHGLYGMEMLTRNEILSVRHRLGRLRTWDITRLHEEKLTPGARPPDRRQQLEEAEQDTQRMKPTLANYGLIDDPTSPGNANRYMFDLAEFEDWQAFRAMMIVMSKEPGAVYDEPYWSEKAQMMERGTQWIVPPEWSNDLPKVGVLGVRYFLRQDANLEARRNVAEKILAW